MSQRKSSKPSVEKTETVSLSSLKRENTSLKEINERLLKRVRELENQPVQEPQSDLDFLDVFTIAGVLHKRFGVYTVFTHLEPTTEDIHPLTASEMTRYEQGHAYQLFKRSRNLIGDDAPIRDYEADRESTLRLADEHRKMRDQGFSNPMAQTRTPVPVDPSIDKTSYEYRTSVQGEMNNAMGEEATNGETVAPNAETEQQRRAQYAAAVAASRREAERAKYDLSTPEGRARDYAARTAGEAFDEAPDPTPVPEQQPVSNDNQSRQPLAANPVPESYLVGVDPAVEGGDFTATPPAENQQLNETVKTVLEMEGLSGEVIKENDIFGQQVKP